MITRQPKNCLFSIELTKTLRSLQLPHDRLKSFSFRYGHRHFERCHRHHRPRQAIVSFDAIPPNSSGMFKPENIWGRPAETATERARCFFRVKCALFNSLIIVCCVFEKKPRTYIDRFFPALSNGAIVFIAKRFLPDDNLS